jgi:hypothetical protein
MVETGENNEGVHMMNPVVSEYTLCGDAWDIGMTEHGSTKDILPTKKQIITCPKCIEVIKECKRAKTARNSN